jgi:hypothetical protein
VARHRRDSSPSSDDVGGLFFDFEPFRTACVSERTRSRRWRQRDVTPPRRHRRDRPRVDAPRERALTASIRTGMEWLAFERFAATWKDYEAAYGYQEMFYWKMGRAGALAASSMRLPAVSLP